MQEERNRLLKAAVNMGVMLVGMITALPSAKAAERPEITAMRMGAGTAPAIDGRLDDDFWRDLPATRDFRQVSPVEGAPSEATEVRVGYTESALYIAVIAFDSDPAAIDAGVMERDGALAQDDFIAVILDPFRSGVDGYRFMVNANGARRDSVIQNNTTELVEWDALWRAAADVNDEGWTAEIEIPFRSLSFDPSSEAWGIQILREIRRKNEEIRWSAARQALFAIDLSEIGRLRGLEVADQGIGLDLQPFLTLRWQRDSSADSPRSDFAVRPSGNLYYRVTPSFTATVSVRPDFSDTPLDERRVNTTRFALFFPETREFFLQDASVFEFGGWNNSDSVNGIPFFSRRIGIRDGEITDILGGVKLSGRVGRTKLGVLSALPEKTAGIGRQPLTVARASTPLFGETQGGIIATHGDPDGEGSNSVLGYDLQLRDSAFLGAGNLQADLYVLRSFSSMRPDDNAYAAAIVYPNDRLDLRVYFRHVGRDFDPGLGFVNRPGTRRYKGAFKYRKRFGEGAFNWVEFAPWFTLTTDLDNRPESREVALWAAFENRVGDFAGASILRNSETIRVPFTLPGGVTVRPGRYDWWAVDSTLSTSGTRPVALNIGFTCCRIYDGTQVAGSVAVDWRPSKRVNATITYATTRFNLSGGRVRVHIGSIESRYNFSPEAQLAAQMQYDNVTGDLSLLARFRWEFRPGSEIFMALGHSAVAPADRFPRHVDSIATEVAFRIGHTLRF